MLALHVSNSASSPPRKGFRHALTYARAAVALHHPGGVRRAGGAGGVNRGGPRRSLRILLRQIQDAPDGKTELGRCSHRASSRAKSVVFDLFFFLRRKSTRSQSISRVQGGEMKEPQQQQKTHKPQRMVSTLRAVQTAALCALRSVFTQTALHKLQTQGCALIKPPPPLST